MFVVMSYRKWKGIKTSFGFELADKMRDGCSGYLPVYDTLEEAKANAGDSQVFEIVVPQQQTSSPT